ncbi:hypothetical protein KY289_031626 [Solanum tuberosum]|nr:hypothetical protein KY289_031626 [Solanum tuberosum]
MKRNARLRQLCMPKKLNNILAIVLHCGPKKYAGRSHHKCREITICGNQGRSDNNPWKVYRNLYLSRAKENKAMLLSRASEKTSTSSSASPMVVTSAGRQVISIAEISSPASVRCKQKKRTKDKKDFECPKSNRKTTLVPGCIFQIDLIDGTATTTTSISGELREKLLSMTTDDIFDITCAKLRKSSWGSSNNTHATLSILSYMEMEHTPLSTTDRNFKKIRPLEISEVEVMATTTATGSSNATPKFEPPTPTKKV